MTKKREAKVVLDQEELDLLKEFEAGKLLKAKNADAIKIRAIKSAGSYLRKSSRINIRISSDDLIRIKRLAVKEGLPYQTFIASILHKYVDSNISKL